VVAVQPRGADGISLPPERTGKSQAWKIERLQAKTHRLQGLVRQPRTRISRAVQTIPPRKRAGKLAYWRRELDRIRRYHATVPGHPWGRIAGCESNRRWAYNGSSGFDGGIQFHPETWSSFKLTGYPRYAWQASPRMQVMVGERVLATQGWRAWPACSLRLGLR
jgi:hypothetical protein